MSWGQFALLNAALYLSGAGFVYAATHKPHAREVGWWVVAVGALLWPLIAVAALRPLAIAILNWLPSRTELAIRRLKRRGVIVRVRR